MSSLAARLAKIEERLDAVAEFEALTLADIVLAAHRLLESEGSAGFGPRPAPPLPRLARPGPGARPANLAELILAQGKRGEEESR